MEEKEIYGYRKQIIKAYWNKGLCYEELAEIMKLSLRAIREMIEEGRKKTKNGK